MKSSAVGVIVATHGTLAEALVQAADLILGRKSHLKAFAFKDGEEPKASSERLQALIKKTDGGQGVILLVDMFGGTPGSLALSMLHDKSVEVITGANLPMAIAAAGLEPKLNLAQACALVMQTGQGSIKQAGQLLKR